MSEPELEDFLILRNDLVDEGIDIRWLKSDVRTRSDRAVTGTFCHLKAEDENAIREHAARAGLPVTRVDLLGKSL